MMTRASEIRSCAKCLRTSGTGFISIGVAGSGMSGIAALLLELGQR